MKKCFVVDASAVGHSASEGLLYKLNPSLASCQNLGLAGGAKMQAEGWCMGSHVPEVRTCGKKHF